MTILLLAKCDMVVRTPSHLSAWAKILNPEQKVVMLARPYEVGDDLSRAADLGRAAMRDGAVRTARAASGAKRRSETGARA